MVFAFLYLVLRRLAGWVAGSPADDRSKDVEIIVLRRQLKILNRQMPRPRLRRRDRLLVAAASRVLSPRGLAHVSGHPVHSLALAPGARAPQVDLPAPSP